MDRTVRAFATAPVLLAALVCSGRVTAAVPPSAADVSRALDHGDARAVVMQYEREDRFDALLDRIAIGDEGLIALAPRLAQGTDAANSEGLRIALAKALTRAPARVLDATIRAARGSEGQVVDTPIDLQKVCSVPFIEPTAQFLSDYRLAAQRALSTVRDARLKDAAATCAKRIAAVTGPGAPAGAQPVRPGYDAMVAATKARCPELDTADLAPAVLLDIEDDFREKLAADDRARLDTALPRDADGGPSRCSGHNGAACDANAYLDAFQSGGLTDVFARHLCEPGVVH